MTGSGVVGHSIVELGDMEAECRDIYRELWHSSRPLSRRELQYRTHLTETAITNRLNRLRERGKITRRRADDDGRIFVYEVSGDGK